MRHCYIILLAIVMALSGCASTSQGAREDFTFTAEGNTGLVVLSTRFIDDCGANLKWAPRNAAMNLSYSKVDGKEAGILLLRNPLVKTDFENPDGYFYIRELPAGRYSIVHVERAYPSSPGAFLEKPIFFEVKAGATRYLGELTIHINGCKPDHFGNHRAIIRVVDQRERDKKLFDARMKKLTSTSFEYSVLAK